MAFSEEAADRQARDEAVQEKRIAEVEVNLHATELKRAKRARRAANLKLLRAPFAKWLRGHRILYILGSFSAGVLLIVWSFYTNDDSPLIEWRFPWLSNLLVNIGAAFLLFGLFYFLTDRLSARVDETERDVGQTQKDFQVFSDSVDRTVSARSDNPGDNPPAPIPTEPEPETDPPGSFLSHSDDSAGPKYLDINDVLRTKMAERRAREEAVFKLVVSNPTSKNIHLALAQAQVSRLISASGPRCELRATDLHVRFVASKDDSAMVLLQLETAGGSILASLGWGESSDAVTVLTTLGRVITRQGLYPGDDMFFAGDLLQQLYDLLMYASRYRQSATGATDIEHVVEILDSGWIIMDRGIAPKSYRAYLISTSRFGELDWTSHIRNKPWPESHHIEEALAIARGLQKLEENEA